MRKTINGLACLLLLLPVVGCQKDDKVASDATLSAEKVIFASSASQKSVAVTYQGDDISLSSLESSEQWCTAEASADEIVISVEENIYEEIRSAVVSVKFQADTIITRTISVSQEAGSTPFLRTTAQDGFKFDCRGGSCTFTVSASAAWTAELVDCTWATLTCDAAGVVITAAENAGKETLSGKVKVVSGELSEEYSFSQPTVADDPYLSLLGEYDIYAKNWYQVSRITSAGTAYCYSKAFDGKLSDLDDSNFKSAVDSKMYATTATLVEDKYGESYWLEDFLLNGLDVPVNFDAATGKLSLQSLWNGGFVYVSQEQMPLFMVGCWVENGVVTFSQNSAPAFEGVLSENRDTITVTPGLNVRDEYSTSYPEGCGVCATYMDMRMGSPALCPMLYECIPFGSNFKLCRVKESAEGTDND